MARQKHKIKEIEEVLQYAEQNGWVVEVHNKSKSHAWGVMKCKIMTVIVGLVFIVQQVFGVHRKIVKIMLNN